MGCSNRVAGDLLCKNLSAVIEKDLTPGMQVVTVPRPNHQELFISASPRPGQGAVDCFRDVAGLLHRNDARVVSLEVFGLSAPEFFPGLRAAFDGELPFPVTWIEEGGDDPNRLVGVQTWAVTGLNLEPIRVDGRVLGVVFEDGCMRTCRLGGLGQGSGAMSVADQSRLVFERMAEILSLVGMNFSDVVRTWFYNCKMLDWYGDFNKVRTRFFNDNGVFDGLVPASTGVGGRNCYGSALTAGLLAVTPACEAMQVSPVASPLQCPALDYGSSFSRAVELALPDHRRLLISGTASIAPEGHTVYVDDVERQVELTMDVVQAILESRRMDWGDVSRGIGYFKDIADAPVFGRYLAAHGLPELPVLLVKEDICRHDLLFELELDAIKIAD